MGKIKVGLNLYSLTRELLNRSLDLEGCFRVTKELGMDQVEIIAFEQFKGYPYPSKELIKKTLDYSQKYGVGIYTYSANLPTNLKAGIRELSEDDMFYMVLNDVKYANLLGATTMRQKAGIGANVLRRMIPYCERYNVSIGIEVSPGQSDIHGPMMEDYLALFQEVKCPYIGFTPDFGIFSPERRQGGDPLKMPLFFSLSDQCNRQELIDLWDYAVLNGKTGEYVKEQLGKMDLEWEDYVLATNILAGEKDSIIPVDMLKEMLPYTIHCHGKFHKALEDGEDWKIPTTQILNLLKEEDYDGYIMIEYEGHDMFDIDATEAIAQHLKKYREILGDDLR